MQTNAAAESGIDEGQKLVILDVRPKEARMQDGIIPWGRTRATRGHRSGGSDLFPRTGDCRDCACPNEESAAMAANHLKQAGFKKIRPLLGGIDAWVQAGQPVERALPSASTATS